MIRWRSHFSSELNHHLPENTPPYTGHQPRMRTNTRINTYAPSIADIIAVIKSLPSKKAAGINGIPAQFYSGVFQPLIHEALVNETLPNEWPDGTIVKIPKNSNLRDCDKWRAICVLPTVSKIIANFNSRRRASWI